MLRKHPRTPSTVETDCPSRIGTTQSVTERHPFQWTSFLLLLLIISPMCGYNKKCIQHMPLKLFLFLKDLKHNTNRRDKSILWYFKVSVCIFHLFRWLLLLLALMSPHSFYTSFHSNHSYLKFKFWHDSFPSSVGVLRLHS